ncbi:MAG: helix-turn-helix domain-containing protein [Deltaproteobacteria bacterium]|nr:helix-turn-helix domain-containing protein [Deltaproteobacteria bacterium]
MERKIYLTVKEACELIRTSRVTLHRMIRKGMVPSYKIGGKRLFNRKELIQWVKSQREGKRDVPRISKKGA